MAQPTQTGLPEGISGAFNSRPLYEEPPPEVDAKRRAAARAGELHRWRHNPRGLTDQTIGESLTVSPLGPKAVRVLRALDEGRTLDDISSSMFGGSSLDSVVQFLCARFDTRSLGEALQRAKRLGAIKDQAPRTPMTSGDW